MRSVICFKDLKQAALYFDRVLPVAFKIMSGTGTDIVFEFPDHVPSRALLDIVFGANVVEKENRYTLIGQIVDNWDMFAKETYQYRTGLKNSREDDYEDLHHAYLSNACTQTAGPIRTHFKSYAESLGIRNADVLLPALESSSTEIEDPVVTLAGLNLVDVTKASWDQIVELRQDQQSQRKLQRLRAFLANSYTGKSLSYIEDDLARCLDDYEQGRQKHGFETVAASISVLLDSANLQAALAVGVGATLLGGPAVGISSAAAIEVGKVAIEFAKRRRQMVDWQRSHDFAYIIDVQAKTK